MNGTHYKHSKILKFYCNQCCSDYEDQINKTGCKCVNHGAKNKKTC
jgi:hypothetical protein